MVLICSPFVGTPIFMSQLILRPIHFVFLLFSLSLGQGIFAQNYTTKSVTEEGYTYQMVEGDPTETRIYKLANGLTVYLSVYRDKPQIYTLIPVRAGSKNDPADNTGLAHYLEHMVFKGTSKIGAKDYAKEKVLLDSIERMFNRYRKIKDPAQRSALYKKIDATSLEASKYCYANEYDKLLSVLGAKGTNAFTSDDQTVYVNSIPSNQLEKWLEIERERFSQLVPRLFHTELEAVYEEKNMSLDDDNDKANEALMSGLFKKHPYGTQTTIGTVNHLKNPSISEIKAFFNRYYVPNNMAICLAGDLDPVKTIKLIDKTFGTLPSRPLPAFQLPKELPLTQPVVKTVIGPEEESTQIGFRLPGNGTREAMLARLMDQVLQNSQAGLIDLNLNQKQKVLGAGTYLDTKKDYSVHVFYGSPKQGQTLPQLRKLLMDQIDSVKQGRFDDWLISAIVNNIKISKLKEFDGNQGRVFTQMNAFIMDENWADVWKETDEMAKVSRQELMDFAKKYYSAGYVAVDKVTGKDPKLVKISKPSITPVALNKDGYSSFYKEVNAKSSPPIEPQFLDIKSDLILGQLKPGIDVLYKKNTATPLFQLTYLVEMGSNHDPKIDIAARLLDFCGAGKFDDQQFKKELFKLGSEVSVFPGVDQTYITVTGLQENFNQSVNLLEMLLNEPKGNEAALSSLTQNILKERENQKLDKRSILYSGLSAYAKFGPVSPTTNVVKSKDLAGLKTDELLAITSKLMTYPHKILYFGPSEMGDISAQLSKLHITPGALVALPKPKEFEELEMKENKVYWVDYDMVQTDMVFLSKSVPYSAELAVAANLYNEYMGGNMSSVVFQELRESKALAYGAGGGYRQASEKGKSNYVNGYIGCQADKLPDALVSMMDLLENMPLVDNSFEMSKEAIVNGIRSERITKSSILFAYLRAQKLGLDYDIRKNIFEQTPGFTIQDLKAFQEKYVKGKKFTLVLVGKRDKIDFDALRKFGTVTELKVDDLFGF
jgi:predicted Zn-dependent peptidase